MERVDGSVLLVRLNYAHKHWTFPGGGVKHSEEASHAAIRELREETGVVVERVTPLYTYTQRRQYKRDTVDVFYASIDDWVLTKEVDVEIGEVKWFHKDMLPSDRAERVDEILERLRLIAKVAQKQ